MPQQSHIHSHIHESHENTKSHDLHDHFACQLELSNKCHLFEFTLLHFPHVAQKNNPIVPPFFLSFQKKSVRKPSETASFRMSSCSVPYFKKIFLSRGRGSRLSHNNHMFTMNVYPKNYPPQNALLGTMPLP